MSIVSRLLIFVTANRNLPGWIITLLAVITIHSNIQASDTLDDLIPPQSQLLTGYHNIDSVHRVIDRRGATGIEGIWQLASNQTTVVIEPCTNPAINHTGIQCLQIVVANSPRRSIRPGTVLGYMIPTARAGYYDARLYTCNVRSLLQQHRRYTMHLTDDGHLSMTPVKQSWKLNLRHSFNFFFRASVTPQSQEDHATKGFVKIYPRTGLKPLSPIYL